MHISTCIGCNEKQILVDNVECIECPKDHYKNLVNECIKCPTNSYINSTDKNCYTCHSNEFTLNINSNKCLSCPNNTKYYNDNKCIFDDIHLFACAYERDVSKCYPKKVDIRYNHISNDLLDTFVMLIMFINFSIGIFIIWYIKKLRLIVTIFVIVLGSVLIMAQYIKRYTNHNCSFKIHGGELHYTSKVSYEIHYMVDTFIDDKYWNTTKRTNLSLYNEDYSKTLLNANCVFYSEYILAYKISSNNLKIINIILYFSGVLICILGDILEIIRVKNARNSDNTKNSDNTSDATNINNEKIVHIQSFRESICVICNDEIPKLKYECGHIIVCDTCYNTPPSKFNKCCICKH